MNARLSALLNTSAALAHLQWAQLLELQVEAFLPTELQALLSSSGWHKARHVMDAGCGNGYYLSQLKAYFPEKHYTGIDLSVEHIRSARANPTLAGVALHHADLLDFQPDVLFDAIILRLVVQHLQGLEPLLASINRMLTEHGSVFILEPDPSAFKMWPEVPKFTSLLHSYDQANTTAQTNRAQLRELPALLGALPGWQVVSSRSYIVPSAGSEKTALLMQIFSLWLDIFERSRALETDFGAVRHELNLWSEQCKTYSQFGFMFIELKRMY